LPTLKLSANADNTALISWPSSANGYWLQQISDLGKTNWTNVTNPVKIVGNQNQVTLPLIENNAFFRLFP
jgi:hypothetical protein